MNRTEAAAALSIAKTDVDLSNEDTSNFLGYGLPDFQPINVTLRQVAKEIRWHSFNIDGSINATALDEVIKLGRTRFIIVG